jgi:uncharacterized membrane protein
LEDKAGITAGPKPEGSFPKPFQRTAGEPVKPDVSPVYSLPANEATNPRQKQAFDIDLSAISGNQWFTIIGVLALLFGIGFFLKYAIDQGWINPVMRVALGASTGALLVILGEVWKDKHKKYAQALTGGGLAILYFSVYASLQYYHLVSQSTAFLGAAVVTVLGVFLAYRYGSKPLAVLALIGGYLSPLMLSSNQNQQIQLLVYLSLLNIGVLGMLAKDFWLEILYVGLLGTGINFAVWFSSFSISANTLNSMIFLISNFFVVVLTSHAVFRKYHEEKHLPLKADLHFAYWDLLSGIFMLIAISALLYTHFHSYLAPVSLLISVIYFIAYVLVDRLEHSSLNYALSFAGSAFLVSACFWQFSGTPLSLYLLAVSMAGIIIGLVMKRKEIRTWGIVSMIVALCQIFTSEYNLPAYSLFVNSKFGLEILAIALIFVVAWAYRKMINNLQEDELQVPAFAEAVGSALLWFAVSWEIVVNYREYGQENNRNLILSVWWMIYSVVLGVFSAIIKNSIVRKLSIGLFILTILKVFLYDVQALELGYRIVSFITLGVILLAVSFAYQKNKQKIRQFLEIK